VILLGGSHHVAGVEHCLSHHPDAAVRISVFGGKDTDVLKVNVMSQTNAIPHHGQLFQVIKTGMSTVFSYPRVK
jgi:hypothetical protein